MHLESITKMPTERSSTEAPTSIDPGVTTFNLNLHNMSADELMAQFDLLDNVTQQPQDLDILKDNNWRIAIIIVYSIVILFGFIENLVIFCVLIKNRHLHTPTNIFIMGLAISDILLCSFNLPFQLHYQLTDQWVFGAALCKVISSTYGVPLFVSSMSILMIAIDRYMLIVHPFRKRMTKLTAVCIIISIAVCTTLLAIPVMIHMEYEVVDIPALRIYRTFCTEMWTNVKIRHIYTVSTIFIQFFVPLIATSLLYIRISNVLSHRPIKKNEKRKNHKTNKILISIVLFFSICWMPWNLFAIILEFNFQIVSSRLVKLFDVTLRIFAMGSACINPFLYGWLNDNFRKELDTLVKIPGRNRIRQNGHTYTLAEQSKTDTPGKLTTVV